MMTVRDKARLTGVHPDLVAVVEAARRQVPFIVVEGLRTRERQAQLVKAGASRTMDSRHLTGHAVDLAPTVEGEVRWDWPLFYPMAKAVKDPAKGCAAVRALYCNDTEGCTISIYLSGWSGIAERYKAHTWRIDGTGKRATLILTIGGAECRGPAQCTLVLRWTGERLLPMR